MNDVMSIEKTSTMADVSSANDHKAKALLQFLYIMHERSCLRLSLLLDKGFKTQERCFFHPLSNDMSISINALGLDKFLKSIGRDPAYIDLEVPRFCQIFLKKHHLHKIQVEIILMRVIVLQKSQLLSRPKEKSVNGVRPLIPSADAEKLVEELLDRTSALLLLEISIKRHGGQLGAEVANNIKKCLGEDRKNLATIFKNTAYTEGF